MATLLALAWSISARLRLSPCPLTDLEGMFIRLQGIVVLAVIGAAVREVISTQTLKYTEAKLFSKYGARKDYFGHAVDVHNDWIIVGAYSSGAFQRDAGSAFSFKRNSSIDTTQPTRNITTWMEMPYIIGSEVKPHDYFGGSIAIWENTAVVGAYLDENIGTNSGTAYVFYYHGGIWKEQQKLSSHNAMAADYFGQCVDISGDTIVVGAYGQADSGYFRGAAYIFERTHHRWTEVAMLRPEDIQDNHMFGFSVAIFEALILVGAYGDNVDKGSNTGSVYTYEYVRALSNETLLEVFSEAYLFQPSDMPGTWTCTQKLIASDARQYSNFGIAVAGDDAASQYGTISSVVIGASTARGAISGTGAAYVFVSSFVRYSSSYNDGDKYEVMTRTWTQQAKLYAAQSTGDEHFGSSVAIDHGTIVVGAPDDCFYKTDAGAAYVFKGSGSSWEMVLRIVGNDTVAYDHFGTDVNIDGEIIVIGSEQADGLTASTGAVYVITEMELTETNIKEQDPLVVKIAREKDQFVFIISILPVLLVVIPICVVSFVVYFDRYYARIASVIGRRIGGPGSALALEEYASLHSSSHHGNRASRINDLDTSSALQSDWSQSNGIGDPNARNGDAGIGRGAAVKTAAAELLRQAVDNASADSSPMLAFHKRHYNSPSLSSGG